MKQLKKTLAILLALCMLLGMLPTTLAAKSGSDPVGNRISDILGNVTADGKSEVQNEKLDAAKALELLQKQSWTRRITPTELSAVGIELARLPGSALDLSETLAPEASEIVRIIVVLQDKALLELGYTQQQILADGAQVAKSVEQINDVQMQTFARIRSIAGGEATLRYRYRIAMNGIAVEAPYGALAQIRALEGVSAAFVASQYALPETDAQEEILPNMVSSKDHFGSEKTWDTLGLTGAGMRIAIIDTGLDIDHPNFVDAPKLAETSMTRADVAAVLSRTNAYALYNSHGLVELTANRVYRSEKIPFAFNYVDESLDVTHDNDGQSDHGTHVAGIAAANKIDGVPVVGVAPDAQLIVMKVFGANGGAFTDDLLAALEDCYLLDVDAVNMSLGSPAGFVDEVKEGYPNLLSTYAEALEHDMIVSISAGNSGSASDGNGLGTNLNLTGDPDNGTVSTPSIYLGATSVASYNNYSVIVNCILLGEQIIPYTESAIVKYPIYAALAGEYEYVMIPNLGEAADYEGLDVAGKIAVVQRGVIAFTEKQKAAYEAGAVACIIYDNIVEDLISVEDAGLLPNIFISKESGALLAAAATNGVGKLTVPAGGASALVPNSNGGHISSFSAWGATPDLQLFPEIAAPGGGILSTLMDGTYGSMNGTSMAAPHIAGMAALVFQSLREAGCELSESELHTLVEALIMSTATPLYDRDGLLHSPRQQGAGAANVYNAIVSPGYLTADNGKEQTPKVSFGDDPEKTGVYTFRFTLHNRSDRAQTYRLEAALMTDQYTVIDGVEYMGESAHMLGGAVNFSLNDQPLDLRYDANGDGLVSMEDVRTLLAAVNGAQEISDAQRKAFDLNADGVLDTADVQMLYALIGNGSVESVTVQGGQSVDVYVKIALSDEDKAYMDTHYENGIFVEGFVRCFATDEEAVDLSLPFMGFYGDWSDARILDDTWYYEDELENYNRYVNVFFTDWGSNLYYLGMNPYIAEEPYDPAHNVLSLNGDGYNDSIAEIYLSMMRGAKRIDFIWTDAETGEVLFKSTAHDVRKSYYNEGYDLNVPMFASAYDGLLYDMTDENGNPLPNGTKIEFRIDAYLDDGDEIVDESVVTPIVIDNEAPKLEDVVCLYNPYADKRYLEFFVSDNYAVAAVAIMTAAREVLEYIPVDAAPGERTLISVDVSNYDSELILAVCDYGCLETFYELSYPGRASYDTGKFYGYRQFAVVPVGSNQYYPNAELNGWYSFADAEEMTRHTKITAETNVYAADFVEGYVLGVDEYGTIFAGRVGTWERTELGKLSVNGRSYEALDMAFDPTSGKMYLLTDELEDTDGAYLVTLDIRDGRVLSAVQTSGFSKDTDGSEGQGVTLACDNDGVLYSIDYLTGDLYTLDKVTGAATRVGATGYKPYYRQSMTVDHATNELYWAAYEGYTGTSVFFRVDKKTGALTQVGYPEYNSNITALFKPYDYDTDYLPDDAQVQSLALSQEQLILTTGKQVALTARRLPYYAPMTDAIWESSDESVATVDENGVVTTVAEGMAVISVYCDGAYAECYVMVSEIAEELYYYDLSIFAWLGMNSLAPDMPELITEPEEDPYNMVLAAAYAHGKIFAEDYYGKFHILDPETFEDASVPVYNGLNNITAMAFNYADNYLYALAALTEVNDDEIDGGFGGSTATWLVRIHPRTGELRKVLNLDEVFGLGIYSGFSIDYEGNFYILSPYDVDYESGMMINALIKFALYEDMPYAYVPGYVLGGYVGNGMSSMTWSEENHGLFLADDAGQLHYIDTSEMIYGSDGAYLYPVGAGQLFGFGFGLMTIPENEPEAPHIEPTGISVGTVSYTILEGGSVHAEVMVEPWNATGDITYSVLDRNIATVNENGMLTGVKAGETVLMIYLEATGEYVYLPVTVRPSVGKLYGYIASDLTTGSSDFWFRISDTDLEVAEAVSDLEENFTMLAGAYYDGYVYAFAKDATITGSYGFKTYLLKIDPGKNFTDYEILAQCDYMIRDMAFDYTTGTLYAMASGGLSNGEILQIDTNTGRACRVGDCGVEVSTMTVDGAGNMFAVGLDGWLYRIDRILCTAEKIGPTGASCDRMANSLFCDPVTGNVYWAQYDSRGTNSLRLVDTATGATTSLGVIGMMGAQVSMLFTIPETAPTVPETVAPNGVALAPNTTGAVGQTLALDATVLPISVAKVAQSLSWKSSDESVATVDENGVVTCRKAGTASITATAENGVSATTTLRVTERERRFYSYDQTNRQWISFTAEGVQDGGAYRVEYEDKEDESKLATATFTDGTIYAFDTDGCFYSIDPETFARTKLSDGLSGQYGIVEGIRLPYQITDISYEALTDSFYVTAVCRVENATAAFAGYLFRLDRQTLEMKQLSLDASKRPGALLIHDGKAIFIDTYYSGIINVINLHGGFRSGEVYEQALIPGYWSAFNESRGLMYDDYTDEVFAIRGTSGTAISRVGSQLYLLSLNTGAYVNYGEIGEGLQLVGMFRA